MSDAAQLQKVLERIDADFDNSLERLFALLRIKSISADPAHAGDCKAAADHLARDIATLGFATEVRPTAGHPAIVVKSYVLYLIAAEKYNITLCALFKFY